MGNIGIFNEVEQCYKIFKIITYLYVCIKLCIILVKCHRSSECNHNGGNIGIMFFKKNEGILDEIVKYSMGRRYDRDKTRILKLA